MSQVLRPRTSYDAEAQHWYREKQREGARTSLSRASSSKRPASRAVAATQTDRVVTPTIYKLEPNEKNTMTTPLPPPMTPMKYSTHYDPYPDYVQRSLPSGHMTPQISIDRRLPHRQSFEPPRVRCGRNGSSWRHIKTCIGNLGNHIVFVDGVVKSDDVRRFPPWGIHTSRNRLDIEDQQYMYEPQYHPVNSFNGLPRRGPENYPNRFHDHAKKGNKYWYDDTRKTYGRYSIIKAINPRDNKYITCPKSIKVAMNSS